MKKEMYVILILILCSSLLGCKKKQTNYEPKIQREYVEFHYQLEFVNRNTYISIHSIEEMNEFIHQYQRGKKTTDKYDENFFTTHSLISFMISENSGGNRHEVVSNEVIKDGILKVDIIQTALGETCVEAYWLILLELSKEEMSHLSLVEMNKKGKTYILEDSKKMKTKMPVDMPSDFEFFISTSANFSYKSEINTLINGHDAEGKPNKVKLVLSKEQKQEIYQLLRNIRFDCYPPCIPFCNTIYGSNVFLHIKGTNLDSRIWIAYLRESSLTGWKYYKELGITMKKIINDYIKSNAYQNP